jgi:hypothetical protein
MGRIWWGGGLATAVRWMLTKGGICLMLPIPSLHLDHNLVFAGLGDLYFAKRKLQFVVFGDR